MSNKKDIENLHFIKSVELVPTKDGGVDDIIRAAELLDSSANVLTSPENPLGRPGIDPLMSLYLVSQNSGLTVMPHITPRDKNLLSVYSHVLTALKFGIDHFFIIGGDPIDEKLGSREVRETDVMGLISALGSNEGYIKKQNGNSGRIKIGAALNPYREVEPEISAKKIENGANFFVTQILYESKWLQQEWIKNRKFKVVAGFFPVSKKSQLNFVKKMHVPVSPEVEEKYENSDNPEATSRKLILDTIDELKGYIDGAHIMPIGRNQVAKDILESI